MGQAKKKIRSKQGPAKKVRIMAFGTFDMVHPGHRHFFKQARALGGESAHLTVSLARNKNVLRIKGRLPKNSEKVRRQTVASVPGVDKAVLGALGNHIPHVIKHKPDIIALGYDQIAYVRGLRSQLKAAGLQPKIVRLKPHKPHQYKTSLIQK